MLYIDNPRKVYGKVKIIYSDGEISSEMAVNVSGNAEISSPDQIYMGYLSPSIKACSMDGNSYMRQGYQMNGSGFICGWKSDVHSGNDNIFISSPWLSISFLSRPVGKWKVIGDSKLNEYPVDFNITLYSGEIVSAVKQVIENSVVNREIVFDEVYQGITKIRIDILKWNKPNAKAKILQFFDVLEEEYAGGDLISFEVLEELSSDSGTNYGITSDTATIILLNKGRKFDKGYLKDMVLLGRKVIPYIGIENNSAIEYTKLGTFYSDEWNAPQSSQLVTLKCADKLLRLQDVIYTGYPYTINASLYDIAEDILIKSGYIIGNYEIDSSLNDDVVPGGFIRKSTAWDALNEICIAGMCNVYIDRNDKLKIVKETSVATDITINADRIFSYDKNSRLTDFSNYAEIQYSDIFEEGTIVTAYENTVVIDADNSVAITANYSADISNALISYMPSAGLELVSFDSGIDAGKFEIQNNTGSAISTVITITGNAVTINTQTVGAFDEESINLWGKQSITMQSSYLIQSYDKVTEIGQSLLLKLKQGSAALNISWRGDPELKLQDRFTATDRFGDSAEYVCRYNRFSYDGGLKQETKGRAINGGME